MKNKMDNQYLKLSKELKEAKELYKNNNSIQAELHEKIVSLDKKIKLIDKGSRDSKTNSLYGGYKSNSIFDI